MAGFEGFMADEFMSIFHFSIRESKKGRFLHTFCGKVSEQGGSTPVAPF
jgi:hypothetical protein